MTSVKSGKACCGYLGRFEGPRQGTRGGGISGCFPEASLDELGRVRFSFQPV